MNRTFDCGIKRTIEARNGELFDITATLPKTVGLPSKLVKCSHCNKSFTGLKYLDIHVRFKHTDFKTSLEEKPCEEFSQPQIAALDVNGPEVFLEENEVLVLDNNPSAQIDEKKPENRHGQKRRSSYTEDFKAKTLEILDDYTELKIKNKWVKIAEKRGVSKCLVVKWNKNRDKIFAELTCRRESKEF